MPHFLKTLWRAMQKFNDDGGTAIASNVALSLLLSLFPFLMLVASLLRIWGDTALVDEVFNLVLGYWPADAARPLAEQIKIIVNQRAVEFFSVSTFIGLFLATNGIESARDGLNRAYKITENRPFLWRRLQSVLFVISGAFGLIIAAIILIGTPIIWAFLIERMTFLENFSFTVGLVKYAVAISVLILTLVAFHQFLPNGRRPLREMAPGIALTIIGMIGGSHLFAIYLQTIANYTALYAGLAGTMIAIVYLYAISALILFGAEFNAARAERRS
ncbi:MAG: YihY/virulence factor BrkB family protein [Hyphomicrobiales bacterium]